MKHTRRSLLRAGIGTAALGSLTGCLGLGGADGIGPTSGEPEGYAAFFTLWDWADHVGGEHFSFETPVSTGQMGHGWSPDGDLTREIATTDAFVYLDTPEFSWAQDVAAELERDYEDIAVVDLLDGLGPHLIGFDSDALPQPDYGHEYPPESLALDEFDVIDLRSDQQLGYWHVDHWHGGIPDVPLDDTVPVGVVIRDRNERVVPLGEAEPYRIDARTAEDAPDDVVEIESRGDHVEFRGLSTGSTAVVFEVWADDEVIYDTAADPAPVDVVADLEDEGADAFHDPHAWVDPVLGQKMVEKLATALSEVDPDNADAYEENAANYVDRMESVHQQFEDLTANAERDVAVFAGHDSFQYLERRYDFDLHTPVGVSPDAAESFEDISNLVEVIETHDVDTVLYDPFEAPDPEEDVPQMVELIFENTDVEDARPLSPAEGTTATWQDRGWGWVEQMEEVNLPSLRAALGA